MFDWFTHRALTTRTSAFRIAPRIVNDNRPTAGEYELLHKYLRDRFANRVVLTFGEIEDLLGFALPDPACADLAWWDVAGPPSTQSSAWTLAGRTATVNLRAQHVVFDRVEK